MFIKAIVYKDLISITEFCETGKIHPTVDRQYPLSKTAEALRYVMEGRAKGKSLSQLSKWTETLMLFHSGDIITSGLLAKFCNELDQACC